jgi:hypothetical protein
MIRRATREDIGAMVGLLRRHHAERGDDFAFAFDPALASIDLAHAIAADDWLCLVADGCMFLGMAFRPPLIPTRVAVECFLRCERPGVRRLFVAEFETWARARGCAEAALATTHSPAAFARLYGRDGYRAAETTFSKVL